MTPQKERAILIGTKDSDHLELTRISRSDLGGYSFIEADLSVIAVPWNGRLKAVFHSFELEGLATGLRELYSKLDETIEFRSVESQLCMTIKGDGRGHISVKGTAHDSSPPGCNNSLSFLLHLDQTCLLPLAKSLDEFVAP
jgi:hypothetical protein